MTSPLLHPYAWSDNIFTYRTDLGTPPSWFTALYNTTLRTSSTNPPLAYDNTPDTLSAGETDIVEEAIGLWSLYADVTFSPTADSNPDIFFLKDATVEAYNSLSAAWQEDLGTAQGHVVGGQYQDVGVIYKSSEFSEASVGTQSFYTILHEIGHVLGLRDGEDVGDPYQNLQNTVMAYDGLYPSTPMIYDIQALHESFGESDYASGNTNYDQSWITGDSKLWTIWDAGGTDTIDISSYGNTQTVIDLRGGVDANGNARLSQVEQEYFAIAFDLDNASGVVDLENAYGGAGADSLIGGYVANEIRGNAGDDSLFGQEGNDTLLGGAGNDLIAWALEDGGTLPSSPGNDSIDGGVGNDTIDAGDGSDTINGGSGNDLIFGNGGLDSIVGGGGNDTIIANGDDGAQDTIYGGDGDDWIFAGGGDIVYSGPGEDTIVISEGTYPFTELFLWGDDSVILQPGGAVYIDYDLTPVGYTWYPERDEELRQAGKDFYIGNQHMNSAVLNYGSLGNGWTLGGFVDEVESEYDFLYGNDTELYFNFDRVEPYNADNLDLVWSFGIQQPDPDITPSTINVPTAYPTPTFELGSAAANSISGGSTDDSLAGLGGNDSIAGGLGNDTLAGGAGRDTLTGGGGTDIFKFTSLTESVGAGSLYDRITDFQDGVDKIDLSGLGFKTLITSGSTTTGQLRISYVSSSDRTYVKSDQVDFGFYLDNDRRSDLDNSDFIYEPVFGPFVNGTASAETLTGTGSGEAIYGLAGNDTLVGGAGADTLDGGTGTDQLTGGTGADTFRFSGLAHSVNTGNQLDRIIGFENGVDKIDLTGLGFTTLTTNGTTQTGELRLTYLSGSDRTYVRTDQSDFRFYLDGYHTVNLDNSDFIFGPTSSINGTSGSDNLTGTPTADGIFGMDGNDTLNGGTSADTLDGGAGTDLLTGDSGADVFKFSDLTHSVNTTSSYDVISDFENGIDLIDLSGLGFTDFTEAGTTNAGEIRVQLSGSGTYTFIKSNQLPDFTIALSGDRTADIDASDFIFG